MSVRNALAGLMKAANAFAVQQAKEERLELRRKQYEKKVKSKKIQLLMDAQDNLQYGAMGGLQAHAGHDVPTTSEKLQALMQALMQATSGLPSAGGGQPTPGTDLSGIVQAASGLPSAGGGQPTPGTDLSGIVQAASGLPSAGGGQPTAPTDLRQLVESSNSLPAASGGTAAHAPLQQNFKGLFEASKNLPSATGGTPHTDPQATINIVEDNLKELRPAQGTQISLVNNAFNGGEISLEMSARFDQPRYQTGCHRLENMVCLPQGGITKRPGIEVVETFFGFNYVRIVPFSFSVSENRLIVFYAIDKNDPANFWVFDADADVPTVLYEGAGYNPETNPDGIPFLGKHLAGLSFVQSADVIFFAHKNYAPSKLSRYSDTDWRFSTISWLPTIQAPVWDMGSNISGNGTGADVWFSVRITAIDKDTGQESLPSAMVKYDKDSFIIDEGNIRRLIIENFSEDFFSENSDLVDVISNYYESGGQNLQDKLFAEIYNYIVLNFEPSIIAYNNYSDKATALARSIVNYISDNDDMHKSHYSDFYDQRLNNERNHYIRFKGSLNACEYRIYKSKGGVYGFIGRVEAEEGGTSKELTHVYEFADNNISPDTEDCMPEYTDYFSGKNDYPSIVFMHQQRLGFASSNNRPLTVWLSQTAQYESMLASTPPEDDDAIEATLSATQANRILWCESDRTSLAIGTEGGEWILQGGEGGVLTPTNLSFQPQTFNGSQSGISILRAGSDLLYVQRGGRVVREFTYAFASDKYESQNLTLLASHIFKNTSIVSSAWQAEPYGIVWCVLKDGTLAACTYLKQHDVIAWHRHTTPLGKIKGIESTFDSSGESRIWLLIDKNTSPTKNDPNPYYILCRMAKFGDAYRDRDEDAFLAYDGVCQPCLPEHNIQNGSTFLQLKKINAIKAYVIESYPFKAKMTGDTELQDVPIYAGTTKVSEAVWGLPLGAGWREGQRLELTFPGDTEKDKSYTLLGLVTTIECSEYAGMQQGK